MNNVKKQRTVNGKTRFLFLVICCLLVSIPFFVVKFPPIVDLPQHVSQVRIFQEAFSDSASPYRIQWLTPYSLVYYMLGACWALVGPENAGRIGMLVIVWLGIILTHYLAFKEKRPVVSAVLASVLFFSHILYLGLYQFALGWVVFIGWVLITKSNTMRSWVEVVVLFIYALVLYMTHVLWLLVAIAWLFFGDLAFRRNLKRMAMRMGSVIPVLSMIFFWYPSLASYSFTSQTIWGTYPYERFSPIWLIDAAFGSLRGSIEYIIFGVLVSWIVVVLWQNRNDLKVSVSKEFLMLFAGLIFLGLVLPEKHVNTIWFCQRWVPPAFSFLLLSMPAPKIRKKIFRVAAVVIVAGFFMSTAISWRLFESIELSGLKDSLNALPKTPRVLGLSYIKESSFIKRRPFIQVFAYSQVYKGGELNFSFADFGPSLVVYKEFRVKPWTRGLEWYPNRLKREDFQHFDYLIVNAPFGLHSRIMKEAQLQPVTRQDRWRLYAILSESEESSDYIP